MMQDTCIDDLDRLEDEMSTVMRYVRHTAVTLVNDKICRIDDFADALNALKQEQCVSTEEIEMLFRFFTSVGISEDDTKRMRLH